METRKNKSGYSGFMLALLMLLSTVNAQAITVSKFIDNVKREMSKDGLTGVYLIAGILGFGIVLFIIVSIVNKYRKVDSKPNNIKPINHKHHHHHRIIKKSA